MTATSRSWGALLDASHASLRDDYEVSVDAVERTVTRLKDAGAVGARIMGGGFGGSVLALFGTGRDGARRRPRSSKRPARRGWWASRHLGWRGAERYRAVTEGMRHRLLLLTLYALLIVPAAARVADSHAPRRRAAGLAAQRRVGDELLAAL